MNTRTTTGIEGAVTLALGALAVIVMTLALLLG